MYKYIIVTKSNNELYLELNIFYNIGLFISGILSIIINSFYCYIILKEKLWTQSIQFTFSIILTISGITLGLRHLIISIINISILDPSINSYDNLICKIKSCIDVLILYAFEMSFGFRMMSFTILIGFPVFYRNYIENIKNNKYIIILTLFISFICSLFYMLDIDDSKDSENCNIHSFIGKAYEYYFMGILLILIGISTPIFIFGMYKIWKLNLNKQAKDNIIKIFNYMNSIFIICWVIPNGAILIAFFLHKNDNLIGLLYDLSILNITFVAIFDFIFTLLHNKTIRKHTKEILKFKNKVNAISNIKN